MTAREAKATPGPDNVRDWLAFEKRRGPLPMPESLPPMRSIEALLVSHDELRDALAGLLDGMTLAQAMYHGDAVERARAALAKAGAR